MQACLDEYEYESVGQLRGSMSLGTAANAESFVRAPSMQMLVNCTVGRW